MVWEEYIHKAQHAASGGDFKAAEDHLNHAKQMSDELSPNDKRRFMVREMLADLMERQNRLKEAESYLLDALDVRKLRYGPIHHRYAEGLQRLASFYFEHERFKEAADYSSAILDINSKLFGPQAEETGQVAGQLADIHYELGAMKDAEELYKKAIAIRRKVAGGMDPQSVYLCQRYANLLEQTGRLDEAAHMTASAQGKISGIMKTLKPTDE